MARLKVLVAGDPGSIHATRFVNLLQEIGYDVRMFQSEHYYAQEEHLHDTVTYVSNFAHPGASAPPLRGNTLIAGYPEGLRYDSLAGQLYRAYRRLWVFTCRVLGGRWPLPYPIESPEPRSAHLANVIRMWQPDVVFSLKMQNNGYATDEARLRLGTDFRAKWIHFSWGTDFEFFGRHPGHAPAHLPRIRAALAASGFLLADCGRDERQAGEFGFRGEKLGTFIASGGFDLARLRELRARHAAKRDVILVKGREGDLVGRGLKVVEALVRIAPLLRGFRVRVMMATDAVRAAVRDLARLGIDCEVLPRLGYEELMLQYGRSRLAISASDVDGTPSFLIEAMAMGALPVHSDMASVREWIEHGVNGLLFPVEDVAALAACIERGLADDALCRSAAEYNWKLTQERMDRDRIRAAMKELIETRVVPDRAPGPAAA